jgi:hypothetical protein
MFLDISVAKLINESSGDKTMPFIEIHCKGVLDTNWSDWFQGITVQPISSDEICLNSEVSDNSAIYGILSTMSSLGIMLISVSVTDNDGSRCIDPISEKKNNIEFKNGFYSKIAD